MRKGFETTGYHSICVRKTCSNFKYHMSDLRGRNILCNCNKIIRLGTKIKFPYLKKGINASKLKGRLHD